MSELDRNDQLPTDAEVEALHDKIILAETMLPRWLTIGLVGRAEMLATIAKRKQAPVSLVWPFVEPFFSAFDDVCMLTSEEKETLGAIKARIKAEIFTDK